MRKFWRKLKLSNNKFGGAALEYILVSTFAAVVTIAALGYVGSVMKKQLSNMSEKLGLGDNGDYWDDPFSEGN